MSRCACDRPLTRESAGPCNLSRSQTASTSSSKLTTRFKPAAALMSIRPLQQIPRGAPVPIVGIFGASGVAYGIRLLQVLAAVDEVETHLVMTPAARRTLALETDLSVEDVESLANVAHKCSDIAACNILRFIQTAGMIVAPCSIKTVASVAACFSDNLLLRAADVTLKERRRLILLVCETPMYLVHLRLFVQLGEMGAIIMPPTAGFLSSPLDGRGHDRPDGQSRA